MAALHPQIVHFTIVLTIIGVAFRLVSLYGRPSFAGPAATTLIVLAAVSSVFAARSGDAAHGPAERVPGARTAVVEHEEWGKRAQNTLLVLGVVELAGLLLRRSPKVRVVRAASAAVGLVAVFCVYEAAEHGGALVYSYAGGVGLRTGDPKDVERLLLAGYYHQVQADRKAGRTAEAAELMAAAAKRFGADIEVRLLAAESLLLDRKDPQAAIAALETTEVPAADTRLRVRRAMLQADAYEAAGDIDRAIAALQPVANETRNARAQQRLAALSARKTGTP
jgi:uncharacterized membrane protein